MEFYGANCEGEWSSLSGLYTAEEADFMAQLLGNRSFPTGGHEQSFTSYYSCDDVVFPGLSHEGQDMVGPMEMGSCLFGEEFCLNQDMGCSEVVREDKCNVLSENLRKRTRNSVDVEKNKKNAKAKKAKKLVSHCRNEEDNNGGINVQSSSSSSEDDSQETLNLSSRKAPALNSNGKTRASRGSATDPQSLYARKRRERINERLRILQNLIPNGTKVDISTMLEEAVQYVKFLQLQIKVLSSDDMWMYAPIAYNGMDIGLDFKVPASIQS